MPTSPIRTVLPRNPARPRLFSVLRVTVSIAAPFLKFEGSEKSLDSEQLIEDYGGFDEGDCGLCGLCGQGSVAPLGSLCFFGSNLNLRFSPAINEYGRGDRI